MNWEIHSSDSYCLVSEQRKEALPYISKYHILWEWKVTFLNSRGKTHPNIAHTLCISGDIAQENEYSTDITQ